MRLQLQVKSSSSGYSDRTHCYRLGLANGCHCFFTLYCFYIQHSAGLLIFVSPLLRFFDELLLLPSHSEWLLSDGCCVRSRARDVVYLSLYADCVMVEGESERVLGVDLLIHHLLGLSVRTWLLLVEPTQLSDQSLRGRRVRPDCTVCDTLTQTPSFNGAEKTQDAYFLASIKNSPSM